MKKNILIGIIVISILFLTIIAMFFLRNKYSQNVNINSNREIINEMMNNYGDKSEEKYFTKQDIELLKKEDMKYVPIVSEKQKIFYGMINAKNDDRCMELANGDKYVEKECSYLVYWEILKRTKDKSYCQKISQEKQKTSILCQKL